MRSDEELMKAYAEGDLAAFEELYKRHKGRVYSFLLKRCSSKQMADEVFQNTFLKLHELKSKYSYNEKFLPWLFIIARSVWIDRLRKEKSEQRKVEAYSREDFSANVAEELESQEFNVNAAILKLPAKQRELLNLRYSEGRSFEEIAQKEKMQESAVRQAISRAVRKLKDTLKGGSRE